MTIETHPDWDEHRPLAAPAAAESAYPKVTVYLIDGREHVIHDARVEIVGDFIEIEGVARSLAGILRIHRTYPVAQVLCVEKHLDAS